MVTFTFHTCPECAAKDARIAELKLALKEADERVTTRNDAIGKLSVTLAELERQLLNWETSEASVCPEDVGFVEYVGVLRNKTAELKKTARINADEMAQARQRIAELDAALAAIKSAHRAAKANTCPIDLDTQPEPSEVFSNMEAALRTANKLNGELLAENRELEQERNALAAMLATTKRAAQALEHYADSRPCLCYEQKICTDRGVLENGFIRCYRCYGKFLLQEVTI